MSLIKDAQELNEQAEAILQRLPRDRMDWEDRHEQAYEEAQDLLRQAEEKVNQWQKETGNKVK